MKKYLVLAFLLFCSTAAFAGFSENGGQGGQPQVNMVSSLKGLPDDTYVTLEGYIEKQVRREHYIFRDASGKIEVEIDDDVWRGVDVTPSDKVRLTAEIDKDWGSTEVDVKNVVKIQ